MNIHFSGPVTVFHGISLPQKATPAGYAAIIDAYNLSAPFPLLKMAIGMKHTIIKGDSWHLLTPRYQPENTLKGHIEFALKYEGIDLCILKKLFETIKKEEIEKIVLETVTGIYTRRIWFLYEWLTGSLLEIPDLTRGNYIKILDPQRYICVTGENSQRHRVVNNLPGTQEFCPLVKRSPIINEYLAKNLKGMALEVAARLPKDVISRAAAFLLLKDSRASFAIEKEASVHDRIERWGNAIREAGMRPLSREELIRLQQIVIGDNRFVRIGYRKEGVFIGEHDRETGMPLVEHIGAKSVDLDSLIQGLLDYHERVKDEIDPIVASAVIAFGFVFIHPFTDGNGRIHRYLIHHVLAEHGYNPPALIFPVSSAMLEKIDEYGDLLRSYSHSILPFIKWESTEDHNVRVLNSTIDYYRYFDSTPFVQFLYQCVETTIEHDLPEESNFLVKYDKFRYELQQTVEMPDRTVYLLYLFLTQNGGVLSDRARKKEFRMLKSEEIEHFQALYHRLFMNGT
ncbi:MAG: Fic family protein [Sphaerochaetaceae bacterium]|nr:Fic family protein [Sphaerochaetaceae bacterium]